MFLIEETKLQSQLYGVLWCMTVCHNELYICMYVCAVNSQINNLLKEKYFN